MKASAVFGIAAVMLSQSVLADKPRDIGEVDTTFRMMGSNDKIKVVAFNDPDVDGVTCWLSRPVKGGMSGAFGFAEEKSNANIACRQTGPIVAKKPIEKGEEGKEVFNEKRSAWFKELHVNRFFDEAANTLVYLTWSDKLVDGSPKNSISTVVMRPWATEGVAPVLTPAK